MLVAAVNSRMVCSSIGILRTLIHKKNNKHGSLSTDKIGLQTPQRCMKKIKRNNLAVIAGTSPGERAVHKKVHSFAILVSLFSLLLPSFCLLLHSYDRSLS